MAAVAALLLAFPSMAGAEVTFVPEVTVGPSWTDRSAYSVQTDGKTEFPSEASIGVGTTLRLKYRRPSWAVGTEAGGGMTQAQLTNRRYSLGAGTNFESSLDSRWRLLGDAGMGWASERPLVTSAATTRPNVVPEPGSAPQPFEDVGAGTVAPGSAYVTWGVGLQTQRQLDGRSWAGLSAGVKSFQSTETPDLPPTLNGVPFLVYTVGADARYGISLGRSLWGSITVPVHNFPVADDDTAEPRLDGLTVFPKVVVGLTSPITRRVSFDASLGVAYGVRLDLPHQTPWTVQPLLGAGVGWDVGRGGVRLDYKREIVLAEVVEGSGLEDSLALSAGYEVLADLGLVAIARGYRTQGLLGDDDAAAAGATYTYELSAEIRYSVARGVRVSAIAQRYLYNPREGADARAGEITEPYTSNSVSAVLTAAWE